MQESFTAPITAVLPTNWEGLVYGEGDYATCRITKEERDVPDAVWMAVQSVMPSHIGFKLDIAAR